MFNFTKNTIVMSATVIAPPPRTMMEVFQSLPEGTLAQLIENNIIMSPVPLEIHQRILSDIFLELGIFIKEKKLGEVRVAPYDVFLGSKNALQPDIIFISKERLHLIEKDGLHGAPDLIIEILSPATAKYDLEEKKDIYERYGVKEYWIVEPGTNSVQGFYLSDKRFESIKTKDGEINSRLLNTLFKF